MNMVQNVLLLASLLEQERQLGSSARVTFSVGGKEFSFNVSFEDNQARETTRTLPMGQTESMTYDSFGRLATTTDFKGQVTQYSYDSLGRLAQKQFFATGSVTSVDSVVYSYDSLGRTHEVTQTDSTGSRVTSYQYNINGQLTQVSSPEGVINYEYDLATGQHTRTYTDFSDIRYGYDLLGRLQTVTAMEQGGVILSTPEVTTYHYDNVGNLAEIDLPNGVKTTYTYDSLNRLVFMENLAPDSSVIFSYEYIRGPTGNVTSVTENTGRQVVYTYDNLYRLTSETITGDPNGINGTISYTYDLVGNRLSRASSVAGVPSATCVYNANDELLTETHADGQVTTYTYDSNGSTLSAVTRDSQNNIISQTTYTYNLQNLLVAADISDSTGSHHLTYRYDANGNRVGQTVDGIETRYLVDYNNPTGYPQIIEERDGNGALIASYVYGLTLISQHRDGQTSYYIFDGHSGVRHLTDAAGNVTDTYAYDAFGITLTSIGVTQNSFLYRGELFDSNTGFYNMGVRDMRPSTGTFTTMDSFAGNHSDPLSLHKYLYASADPVNRIDPTGKISLLEITISIAIVLVVVTIYLSPLPGKLQAYKAGAGLQGQSRIFAGEPSLISQNMETGTYDEDSLVFALAAYGAVYPDVCSRTCSYASHSLDIRLAAMTQSGELNAKMIFLPAYFRTRETFEADNILILIPANSASSGHLLSQLNQLGNPAWYNQGTAAEQLIKRGIIFFYPGSVPLKPVGHLFNTVTNTSSPDEDFGTFTSLTIQSQNLF